VNYKNVNSDIRNVTCGVPQGSVLGPLLFIIYTNDLPRSIKTAKSIVFADDTTVYASSSSLTEVVNIINHDLGCLADWFRANRLSLNVGKTHYVLFSKMNTREPLNIYIGNTTLERKHNVKFLGVIVGETLEWLEHIKNCKAKLSSSLYAINSPKNYLPTYNLLMLYNSLVHSQNGLFVLLCINHITATPSLFSNN
jgi:ribonuclease P/MRP protein subunit RPP40